MSINEETIHRIRTMMQIQNSELDYQRLPLDVEDNISRLIREGRYDEIHLSPFEKIDESLGYWSADKKTQHIFLVVSATTIWSRIALNSGVKPDEVFDLSDAILLTLSYCQTDEDIHDTYQTSAIMFAKQVHELAKNKDSWKVEQAKTFISANIFRKITLPDVASYTELSESYLCTLFNKQVGISIYQYIQREKINIACNLLSQTTRSVSDIAQYMGFASQSNFTSVFLKWQGMTPSEYRKQHYREVF